MRTALFLAILGALVVVGVTARAGARPGDTFVLEEHDTIIVEAPGCRTDCAPQGTRRVCRVKDLDCRAVCRPIPGCNLDGMKAVQACAVVKDKPF